MRFIHIADTHLGLSAFTKIDPETGMNLRERLLYENFLSGIEEIIRQRPSALVHAGDLFDRVKPKTRAYTTVLEALERLKEEGIPFIVISGNHSMPKTRYTTSPLEVLTYHAADVHAAYRYRYERVEVEDTTFHLIPNMLRPVDYVEAYNEIELSSSTANVLVTHGLVGTLVDQRLKTVAEHELDATMLSQDFDYIALGHFHDQRQVADNAWYAGSVEYCSYGEIRDEKGGLIVDTENSEVNHLALPHTPMFDLGLVRCSGLSPADIMERIISSTEKIPGSAVNPMCQLTLDGIRREDARMLDRRRLAVIRNAVLDLRLKVITEDDVTGPVDETDLRAIDYVGEFEVFLKKKNLDPRLHASVAGKGTAVLKEVLDRHREEKDAAE